MTSDFTDVEWLIMSCRVKRTRFWSFMLRWNIEWLDEGETRCRKAMR